MACICPCGATALFHWLFFLPWASLDNVLPLQTSSHRSVHRNDAVMERTGKKIIMPLKVIINFRSASLLIRYTILLPP